MSNPLTPILDRFRLATEALAVVERIIESGADKSLIATGVALTGQPQQKDFKDLVRWAIQSKRKTLAPLVTTGYKEAFTDLKVGLDRLAVVELAAAFERVLRLTLVARTGEWVSSATPDQVAFRERIETEIEWWGYKDLLLDLFPSVSDDVRGEVKQVVERRDWIAHGKHTDPNEKEPTRISAEEAYKRLTRFLEAAGIVT